MQNCKIKSLQDNKLLDLCIGVFSPYKYNLTNYKGYDIAKFKDNIRFVSVLLNRNGLCNGVLPLYFDGAVNYFAPLSAPNNSEEINKVYTYLDKIRGKNNKLFTWFNKLIKKN